MPILGLLVISSPGVSAVFLYCSRVGVTLFLLPSVHCIWCKNSFLISSVVWPEITTRMVRRPTLPIQVPPGLRALRAACVHELEPALEPALSSHWQCSSPPSLILHVLIYIFRLLHILYYTTSLVFLWLLYGNRTTISWVLCFCCQLYLLYIRETAFLLNILSISLLVLHFCVYSLVPTLFTRTNKYSNLCLNLLIHLYMILFLSLLSILCKMMPGKFLYTSIIFTST